MVQVHRFSPKLARISCWFGSATTWWCNFSVKEGNNRTLAVTVKAAIRRLGPRSVTKLSFRLAENGGKQ
jgi:hypothetical protein